MQRMWRTKPLPTDEKVATLSKSINVNPYLARLLLQREINDFESARHFFTPQLDHCHDPFLMADMDKAVERLIVAFKSQEKILIYGDYDVDGTTSVALVYDFLKSSKLVKSENIGYYIPDRYSEGYGISFKGIDHAFEEGVSLIIALDCGIRSMDKIQYATQKKIDFIICDHHHPGNELPAAHAVLDPKRNDCLYPFKELSGCGVGFKLLQALSIAHQLPLTKLFEYTDLLALSIAADIVPIKGENRIFCFYGLKRLNENPRPGLKALIGISGFKKELTISNVVFGLAPRINAAGRIAHAHAAIDLLLAESEEAAVIFAGSLNEKNSSRKDFDTLITREALEMIQSNPSIESLKSTVLFKSDWHKGVIGIVASRCIEKYYRPTIILTESNGKATGSARSVDGFDIHEAISECAALLDQFGGHTHAAGLTLPMDKIEEFAILFDQIVSERITTDQLIPKIEIDLEVDFSFITDKVYHIINRMGPFGPGNMTPTFSTSNVIDAGNSKMVGDNHLKLFIRQQGSNKIFEGIGFGMGEHLPRVMSKKPFDICYTLSENTFNDNTTLQLNIKDLKFNN